MREYIALCCIGFIDFCCSLIHTDHVFIKRGRRKFLLPLFHMKIIRESFHQYHLPDLAESISLYFVKIDATRDILRGEPFQRMRSCVHLPIY